MESREDDGDFKAILEGFKSKCQKLKIWDYITKSVPVIGVKEIAMCINFGEDLTSGFKSRIGSHTFEVNQTYVANLFNLPKVLTWGW